MSKEFTITVKTEMTIPLSVEIAAQWFAELDDDTQAKFFVEVARRFDSFNGDYQLYCIGGHLQHCKCSTSSARELIKNLASYIDTSTHGKETEIT